METPELLDVIALVRAHLAGDEETLLAILHPLNQFATFAATVGLLVDDLLAQCWPGGHDGLDEHLAEMQFRASVGGS